MTNCGLWKPSPAPRRKARTNTDPRFFETTKLTLQPDSVLFSRQQIANRVSALAAELRRDYGDKNPLVVGVLTGAFVFLSDLIRQMDIPLEVDFVRLASYGAGTQTSGHVELVEGLRGDVQGRHVLVVEDIVDTGLTLRYLLEQLAARQPASLRLCAFLSKPRRRRVDVPLDYLGFEIEDYFVVGYGLDYDRRYRYLPDIWKLKET